LKSKTSEAEALGSTLENLIVSGGDETPEKILLSLLDKQNVEMKTEIDRPLKLAQLKTIENWLRKEKMLRCANSIKIFIENYLVYQVSRKRQSRKETVTALQALNANERNQSDKLTEPPRKE
jgi:hypothetical protein